MSETKHTAHTPGPWELRSDLPYTSHGIVVFHGRFEENRTVCRLREGTQEERDANANLIAAAPEMLEALNGTLVHFVGQEHVCIECGAEIGPGSGCDTCYVVNKAEEAIAKARGVIPSAHAQGDEA